MRTQYWSCSKFADWLRGIPKPEVGTSKTWEEWQQESKKKHPLRFWLAEEGLDKLQVFLFWPIDKLYDIKYYINNRWVTKTHALSSHPRDIKRGEWCDVGNRFLPCMFNELVDFVELELAWWHIAWSNTDERKKYNAPFWASGWFRWRTWRCPQAGLDNLNWQRNLVWEEDHVGKNSPNIGKPTPQAIAAEEVLALYKWWTEVYPNRPDPYGASGWTEYCERMRQERGDGVRWIGVESSVKETKALGKKAHKLLSKIEADYEKEDEEMLIRLIRIRGTLWT